MKYVDKICSKIIKDKQESLDLRFIESIKDKFRLEIQDTKDNNVKIYRLYTKYGKKPISQIII